uniref:Uncharacterized protein n=1 Tax=Arundo donax TaxID=35708 RepID=A0A0A9A0Q2_ARUDO
MLGCPTAEAGMAPATAGSVKAVRL